MSSFFVSAWRTSMLCGVLLYVLKIIYCAKLYWHQVVFCIRETALMKPLLKLQSGFHKIRTS